MPQRTTASLALRATLVLFTSASITLTGAVLDTLAGTSPLALLVFLALGSLFGTVMICVVIASSFPKPPQGTKGQDGQGDEQASDRR